MLDCLWGLLDGVNDAGLAVSLTLRPGSLRFGGRCRTVLRRVPVHMSYNVTVLDRSDERVTVYLAPDRPARVSHLAAATSHQGEVEWAPYVAAIQAPSRSSPAPRP